MNILLSQSAGLLTDDALGRIGAMHRGAEFMVGKSEAFDAERVATVKLHKGIGVFVAASTFLRLIRSTNFF
jgi:cytochrome b561